MIRQAHRQLHQTAERRRTEAAANLKLSVVERGGIAGGDGLDRRMVGLIGLDYREAWHLTSTCTSNGLREELIRPLGGPLVRQIEGDVGRHDADQRYLGNVEPLGDQARADQDVEATFGEGIEYALDGALVLGDVAVEAADSEVRKGGPDLLLDALRPATEIADPGRAADGATRREGRRRSAVMAAQRDASLMVDQS